MSATFQPVLLNGSTGDPAALVRLQWSARRLLFDLGDLSRIAPRDALRITDVFLSHTHMDHFIGFDHLLRLHLGRDTHVRFHGPEGLTRQMAARLGGYTWNLVGEYTLTLESRELRENRVERTLFRASTSFGTEPLDPVDVVDGCIYEEPALRVTAEALDHGVTSWGFRIEEPEHLHVDGAALEEAGLVPGPWLGELKRAVQEERDLSTELAADTMDGGTRRFTVERAAAAFLRRTEGQAIAYASDLVYSEENAIAVTRLAKNADPFLCESTYLETEAAEASARFHLTAAQAGKLAARAGAKSLLLFHVSPRYHGGDLLHAEEAAQHFDGPIRLLGER